MLSLLPVPNHNFTWFSTVEKRTCKWVISAIFLVHVPLSSKPRQKFSVGFRYNTSITLRRPGRIILLAWLIPLLISLYLVLGMFATTSDTALKVLRLTGVSGFDILCSTLFVYAVVRILAVICAQSLQNSAMESLRKQLQTSLKRAPLKTAASRRPHSLAPFIIALVVFFLACNVVKNYLILRIMFVSDRVSDTVALVVTILLVASSAANPLVYAFLKQDIKRERKGLIYGRGSVKT